MILFAVNQWLQFDIGPPTLVTGLITKGRGDTGKKHWVTRYRLSYSNDSQIWYFYKDASHLDPKVSIYAVYLLVGAQKSYTKCLFEKLSKMFSTLGCGKWIPPILIPI